MTDSVILTWVEHHGIFVFVIGWLMSFFAGYMPSPNGGKILGSTWYKMCFALLHFASGALSRVAVQFLPKQLAQVFAPGLPTDKEKP
jgi:hypothetical protein